MRAGLRSGHAGPCSVAAGLAHGDAGRAPTWTRIVRPRSPAGLGGDHRDARGRELLAHGRPRCAAPTSSDGSTTRRTCSRRRPARPRAARRRAPSRDTRSMQLGHREVGELARAAAVACPPTAGSTTCASPATPSAGPAAPARCTSPARATRGHRRRSAEAASSPIRTIVSAIVLQAQAREQLLDAAGDRARAGTETEHSSPSTTRSESSSSATSLAPARSAEHGLRRSRRACRWPSPAGAARARGRSSRRAR